MTTAMTKDSILKNLVDEAIAIQGQLRGEMTRTLIKLNWELGQLIEDNLKYISKTVLVGEIAKALGVSDRHVYRCSDFYKTFKAKEFNIAYSIFPHEEGKNPSWTHILRTRLTETTSDSCPHKKTHKIVRLICNACGSNLKI